jgi:hypothetical protein
LLILLMLLQQIEWFDATMLVQWSIQIYRTIYIIWLYESFIVCSIFTPPHMFEYHPHKVSKTIADSLLLHHRHRLLELTL